MHATIIMEGRLVTDPEVKSGKNGDYCTFRFVVNTKYGNQDNASFFNCTAYDQQLSKGPFMAVQLSLRQRRFQKIQSHRPDKRCHFHGQSPFFDVIQSVCI